jgi:hypothetical protein
VVSFSSKLSTNDSAPKREHQHHSLPSSAGTMPNPAKPHMAAHRMWRTWRNCGGDNLQSLHCRRFPLLHVITTALGEGRNTFWATGDVDVIFPWPAWWMRWTSCIIVWGALVFLDFSLSQLAARSSIENFTAVFSISATCCSNLSPWRSCAFYKLA